MILLILIYSVPVLCLKCPVVTCTDVESKSVCAKISDNSITVQKCAGNYDCTLQEVISAYEQGSSEVPCNLRPYNNYYIEQDRVLQISESLCTTYYPLKRHKKSHPIFCDSSSDCVLNDESSWFCKCSTDGNSYCALAPGDDDYLDLRKAACDKELEKFLYHSLKIQLYPEVYGLTQCLEKDWFADVSLLNSLDYTDVFEVYEYDFSLHVLIVFILYLIILI